MEYIGILIRKRHNDDAFVRARYIVASGSLWRVPHYIVMRQAGVYNIQLADMSQALAGSEGDGAIEAGAEGGSFAEQIVGIPKECSWHNKSPLSFVNSP